MSWRKSRAWRVIRVVWATFGVAAIVYLVLSFNARGVADEILASSATVRVVETDSSLSFLPAADSGSARLLFVPGGIVHPHAYAPLLRAVAEAGHPATLVKLPVFGRHAPGDANRRAAVYRARQMMAAAGPDARWLVAGHSLGGLMASMLVQREPERVAALVLLGTTHPRDFSIAEFAPPVIKVYGTRDGIAPLDRMRANAANLPGSTRWVAIEGGNHSQFGWYGFQVGDRGASITRQEQQSRVLEVLLAALRETREAEAGTTVDATPVE